MKRDHRHIKDHEKETSELKRQGKALREIGERLGFTHRFDVYGMIFPLLRSLLSVITQISFILMSPM